MLQSTNFSIPDQQSIGTCLIPCCKPSTHIRIAIDGPAASGKTTIGRATADRLGLAFVDTGLMYRAVTAKVIEIGVDLRDEKVLTAIAHDIEAKESFFSPGQAIIYWRGKTVEGLKSAKVDAMVSDVSALPAVRRELVRKQRSFAERTGVVMAGRDIGSKVLWDASVKIYFTALLETRARRIMKTVAGISLKEVEASLQMRDRKDSTRADSPLKVVTGTVLLNTDSLSVADTVDRICCLALSSGSYTLAG